MSTRQKLILSGEPLVEAQKDSRSPWAGLPNDGAPAPPAATPPAAAAQVPEKADLAPALTKSMIAKELAVVKVDEYVMTKDGHVSVVAEVKPLPVAYQIVKSWTSDKDVKVCAARCALHAAPLSLVPKN